MCIRSFQKIRFCYCCSLLCSMLALTVLPLLTKAQTTPQIQASCELACDERCGTLPIVPCKPSQTTSMISTKTDFELSAFPSLIPQNCPVPPQVACRQACPNVCSLSSGIVYPKFTVLAVLYAPPGCTSLPNATCQQQGYVDYSHQNSIGSQVTQKYSFQDTVTTIMDTTFKALDFLTMSSTDSWSTTTSQTTTATQTVTKTAGSELKTNPSPDGINHDEDSFVLLLNPAVGIYAIPPISNITSMVHGTTSWAVGIKPYIDQFGVTHNAPLTVQYSVGQLKALISAPNQQDLLIERGFTSDDFTQILSTDPFANGSTAIDIKRFSALPYNVTYEALSPATDSDGNQVMRCDAATTTIVLKNETGQSNSGDFSTSYTSSFNMSVGIPKVITSDFKDETKWTQESVNTQSSTSDTSATMQISCHSSAWKDPYGRPTIVGVFWDNIYNSYMFAFLDVSHANLLAQGTLKNASGNSLAQKDVSLVYGKKTYRTRTDSNGAFRFYEAAATVRPRRRAKIVVDGASKTVATGQEKTVIVQH